MRKAKVSLTNNHVKINVALEDVKRTIDSGLSPWQKVKKIEEIIKNLYE